MNSACAEEPHDVARDELRRAGVRQRDELERAGDAGDQRVVRVGGQVEQRRQRELEVRRSP